ncbi:MAG TPA: hypothetical protein VFG69_17705 [Nannocystaceae bacterium]|nr:hypothetical protein [Nannocystaceae bacterium]
MNTTRMTRKQFLDLGLGAIGGVGLSAYGGCFDPNDGTAGPEGSETGSAGTAGADTSSVDTGNGDANGTGNDDGVTLTDPSTTADDGSSSATLDPSGGSTSSEPDTSAGDTSNSDTETSRGESTDTDTSSTSGGGSTGEAACDVDPAVVIANNHMHAMAVTLAEVEAAVETVYDITGAAGHSHSVTLTQDHFEMLAQGLNVMVVSTIGSAHSHMITVSCG